jgi:hypothetical protein
VSQRRKKTTPTEEQPLMASNILGEDGSGFDFEYNVIRGMPSLAT